MPYKPGGVLYQLIVLEEDEEGQVIGEHVLPLQKIHQPYGESLSTAVRQQMREFAPPGMAEARR